MKIDFERYRRTDGTLKLYDMFRENPPNDNLSRHQMEMVKTLFKAIEGTAYKFQTSCRRGFSYCRNVFAS